MLQHLIDLPHQILNQPAPKFINKGAGAVSAGKPPRRSDAARFGPPATRRTRARRVAATVAAQLSSWVSPIRFADRGEPWLMSARQPLQRMCIGSDASKTPVPLVTSRRRSPALSGTKSKSQVSPWPIWISESKLAKPAAIPN